MKHVVCLWLIKKLIKMELLNLDLNEIASKAIQDKVGALESDIQRLEAVNLNQSKRVEELQKQVKDDAAIGSFVSAMRARFVSIEDSESDSGGWFDSKQKKQYDFIRDLLKQVFGIEQMHGGWCCNRHDGDLKTHLAVNYYEYKNEVCDILRVLNCDVPIGFIKAFRMPYDWPKHMILTFAKSPKYNTNASMIGVSSYWINSGAGESNVPHDLMMKSAHMIDEDVFGTVLTTIKNQRGEYYTLFELPIHNKLITADHIEQIGRCLVKINPSTWGDCIVKFIEKNMLSFCDVTLEYLYTLISRDNQYKVAHWTKFPSKYQERYLKELPFTEALKAVNDYSCTLKDHEKTNLLKTILTVS